MVIKQGLANKHEMALPLRFPNTGLQTFPHEIDQNHTKSPRKFTRIECQAARDIKDANERIQSQPLGLGGAREAERARIPPSLIGNARVGAGGSADGAGAEEGGVVDVGDGAGGREDQGREALRGHGHPAPGDPNQDWFRTDGRGD